MTVGLLKAGVKGDPTNSTGKDVADTVNGLMTGATPIDAITLAGLPQTAGAPAGYGDLASAINAAPFPRFSPVAQATSNDAGGIAFSVASGSPVITYENALLNLMLQKGFSVGRSALVGEATWCKNIDADTAQQRLVQPIIGHLWAGTTAAEATNIANIVSRIQAVANANGVDAFLMLHIVQPTATADGSMSSIGIRVSDLNTIAAAIKTEVDAGRLEAVTMPELAARRAFWDRI